MTHQHEIFFCSIRVYFILVLLNAVTQIDQPKTKRIQKLKNVSGNYDQFSFYLC